VVDASAFDHQEKTIRIFAEDLNGLCDHGIKRGIGVGLAQIILFVGHVAGSKLSGEVFGGGGISIGGKGLECCGAVGDGVTCGCGAVERQAVAAAAEENAGTCLGEVVGGDGAFAASAGIVSAKGCGSGVGQVGGGNQACGFALCLEVFQQGLQLGAVAGGGHADDAVVDFDASGKRRAGGGGVGDGGVGGV